MTLTTITPQFLQDLLDTHGIGADALDGAGLIEDRSRDHDHSEVTIIGIYDLSAVAHELNTIDDDFPTERRMGVRDWIIVVLLMIIATLAAVIRQA